MHISERRVKKLFKIFILKRLHYDNIVVYLLSQKLNNSLIQIIQYHESKTNYGQSGG